MAYLGIDTAARITAQQAKNLAAQGVSFAGRYLVPEGMGKDITAEEIAILHGAGLAILLCWELDAAAMKGGAAQGTKDASRASKLAEQFGVPAGTTIFFAADYDVPTYDLSACEQYMLAAQAAMPNYVAGIYGGERVVRYLTSRGSARKAWQCVAWTRDFADEANVRQYQWQGGAESLAMAKATGILAVDMNRCDDLKKAGLWMPLFDQYDDGDGGVILAPSKPAANPDPWYKPHMDWAAENGIMTDGRPNDNITRAETATVLHREDERVEERIEKLEARIEMLEASLDQKVIEVVKRRLPDDDSFGGLLQ